MSANTSAPTRPSHSSRYPYSERCRIGRTLANQWMSMAVSSGTSITATTASSLHRVTSSAASASVSVLSSTNTFLEALKKPPSVASHGVGVTEQTTSGSRATTPTDPLAQMPPSSPPATTRLAPLVPVDECLHATILGILRDISLSGAHLPDASSAAASSHQHHHSSQSAAASRRFSPSSLDTTSSALGSSSGLPTTPPLRPDGTPAAAKQPTKRRQPLTPLKDPDVDHWREIKEKLLHLRTQIRNRDEFDAGLVLSFGDEWSRTVQAGSVDDDEAPHQGGIDPSSLEDADPAADGGASPQNQTAASRRTPGGSTAPPSPICLQQGPGEGGASFGTSPPPQPAPPSLDGQPTHSPATTPTFSAAVVNSTSQRLSPPPQMLPTGINGTSPVARVAGYHLETRDEMLRRRNNSLNGSTTSNPFNNSLTTPVGASTPRTRSLSNSPLMGPMLCGVGAVPGLSMNGLLCPFDYIMVLDFEATCDEPNPPNFLHEIIEFPVVVVDVQSRRTCMEFHSFVRPMVNATLSPFCKQLTGIRQEDVDTAPTLPEVIRRFEVWFKNSFPPQARVIFATDGPWDMRDFMYHHSYKRQGIQFPALFYQWIDVKSAFANFFHAPRQRIQKMLEYLGMHLEGRLHSGIDDSRNIARIVIGLLVRGCSLCDLDRLPYIGAPSSIDSTS